MKERINLLEALSEQQVKLLSTVHAIEKKIEHLEKQINILNNCNEIKVSCEYGDQGASEVMVSLKWSDHTAAEADETRKTVRAILQARLQACRDRLQRAVENEESRLATLLKAHGNTELSTPNSAVQNAGTQEG